MAAGIQHIQAAQFIEVSSPGTRGMAALKDIKWQNSNLTCGISHWGRSNVTRQNQSAGAEIDQKVMDLLNKKQTGYAIGE